MKLTQSAYSRLFTLLSVIFYQLFGSFSWSSPPWLKRLSSGINALFRPNPWRGLGALLTILASIASVYWYIHQPEGILISAEISPPTSLRDSLTIDFVNIKNKKSVSVAPIEYYDKEVETGIKMQPALAGRWQWIKDNALLFTPTEDWPAEQTYKIHFDRKIFDSQHNIKSYRHEFSTLPLEISVSELRLYQDLVNPQLQNIVGTLYINFPVDEKSLIEHTSLIMQESKNDRLDVTAEKIPVTITFENLQKAYIKSEPVTLPEVSQFVNLIINAGVKTTKGSSKSKSRVAEKILLPDYGSFLQIERVNARIQHDKQQNPEQILEIKTSIGVSREELSKHLKAYILPKDYPATAYHEAQKNYSWSKPGEIIPEVFQSSVPVALEPFPEEHPFPTIHRFKLHAATPSYLFVQIENGLAGAGKFHLTNDYKTVIPSPDYAQEIQFLHNGSLLAKSGEKKITVALRGIPEAKFSICKILEQNINHLVTQTYGNFQNPQFRQSGFRHDAISQIFSEFRQFTVTNPCDVNYTSIDLTQYLENSESTALGLFLLKAQGWDSNQDKSTEIENDRLLLITDMALIVKDNADETHDLFVQSITEGEPVADAEVSILGKNSVPIIKAITDAEGHVTFPSMHDFKEDREPVAYLVRKGEDVSFIPYQRRDRMLNYSRFDTKGTVSSEGISAFVFSDRGMYRPGDLIHIGAIIKNRFAQDLAHGLPLEVTITDPQDVVLMNQKLSSSNHVLELDYSIPENAPTGGYLINLYAAEDNQHYLGGSSVRVEEFLPDRLKMEASFLPDHKFGWLLSDKQRAKINVWNLFGGPAVNHLVKAKMTLSPRHTLYFSQYDGYSFVNPLRERDSEFFFSENFTDAYTDENGEVLINLQLERFSKGTYQLDLFIEGFETGGGRAVSTEISNLVTPFKHLVGHKTQGDVNFLKQYSKETVHFIAITPEMHPAELNNAQMQLLSVKTASTLVKKPDGTYEYQSERQKTKESEQAFTIPLQGNHYILPTDVIGDFVLQLNDEDGNLLTELAFSVVGETLQTVSKNAELTVKLGKKIYEPGETIEMQISAPYKGAGLVTIERDNVHAYKWFKADSTNSVQTIEIPSDFQGNGYINVAFVRAWDSDETFINPLSYSVVPFTISKEQQTLRVNLDVPAFVRAGEELPIQFSTNGPSKIVLFAVDEGILRLDNYETPDPLAHFFRKNALLVKTSQTADLILPKQTGKRDAYAIGGDKRTKLLAMNFNPFKRKAEKAVAFWSGTVDSDSTPKTVRFRVPDYFNGSLRIMAVAAAYDKVGSAEKNTNVQSYFTIQPNIASFIAPSDTLTVTAAITNGLKEDDQGTTTTVTLATTPQLVILGSSEESIMITPGQERQVSFQIQASGELGEAELTFTVQQGELASKITSSMSVRPSCAYRTYLISGFDSSANKSIQSFRNLYPEQRVLEASISTNPLLLAHGLQGFLENSPFDCTELLICKSLAQLAMANHPFFQIDHQKAQEYFKTTIQKLRPRQFSRGGFSYWPGQSDTAASASASVLAMDFLTEAKHAGYSVPEDVFRNGIHYLEDLAKQDADSLVKARKQAHAIYLLTRNGLVTTNYITNVQLYLAEHHKGIWNKDITSAYLAASHKLMQSSNEANHLIKDYELQNLLNDSQYIILLARHFPEHLKKMHGEAIMALAEGISSAQLDTLSAAYSIQALSAFAQGKTENTLSISEVFEDGSEKALPSSVKVNFGSEIHKLRFHNPTKETYFYQITQTGFDKDLPKEPIKNGLEIHREYRDSTGKVVQRTQLGNKIKAHIKARVNQSPLDHVAIVDLLPGGFEIIPHSVSTIGCDYVDVREDRIIFYCSLISEATELSYDLRAINKGEYTVPPIFAQAMYQPAIQAQGVASQIVIQE